MATFDALIDDLTRDVQRACPNDPLQFCANWFQSRLEEQRARSREIINARRSSHAQPDLYLENPPPDALPRRSSVTHPPLPHRPSLRNNATRSPFGTLNIPGNALLSEENELMGPPSFTLAARDHQPMSPLTTVAGPFVPYETSGTPQPSTNPGDYLHPPTSTIFARRTSVSAESIAVDSNTDDPPPLHPKTPDQLRRIKASIANNFIFRDLDEEQESGALSAMQEVRVAPGDVVIRQGDVGDYFYVVEAGLLHCYIRPEPLPPSWLPNSGPPITTTTTTTTSSSSSTAAAASPATDPFLQPGYHAEFGRKVAECKPGNSFGELALMYGHPRAATVLAIEPSVLWSVDRITFRTIILKAAHRRRTMYEQFLSSVTLLSSLKPEERSKIADALVSKVYADGEAVVKQGDVGDTFFFVEEGEASVTKSQLGDDGEMKEITVGLLQKGDYFGELSLLLLAPRAATVSAVYRTDPSKPKLKVAALDAHAFTRLLGPLREIMERKAGERYGPTHRINR